MTRGADLGYLSVLPRFEYVVPSTVEQACFLLAQYKGNAKVLAGGTDLLVFMKKRRVTPRYLVSIKDIPLDYIKYSPKNGLRIGARTTLQTVADNPIVRNKFGLLATACKKVGSLQVRNMGTVGGNICNAGPSQDTIPSLLVLDARLKLVSTSGERIVPIDTFFTGPFQTVLREVEILTEIHIPTPLPGTGGDYHWFTKMSVRGETLVGVAALLTLDPSRKLCNEIKIGLCSVAPAPFRAKRAEEVLRGKGINRSIIQQAAKIAAEEIQPRSRSAYRRKLTSLLVELAVNQAWGTIRKQGGAEHDETAHHAQG